MASFALVAFVKSAESGTKFASGKSAAARDLEAPTTVAPVPRNACVMKDPSPPLAPVIRTVLFFDDSLGSMAGCFLWEVRAWSARKVSNRGFRAASVTGLQLRAATTSRDVSES